MDVEFREIGAGDYQAVLELWQSTGDMAAAMIDSPRGLKSYLRSNNSLSLVAVVDGKVVGTILYGHDGEDGQQYQLAVAPGDDATEISQKLLGKALQKLSSSGAHSARLVLSGKDDPQPFWQSVRWDAPPDYTETATHTIRALPPRAV